MTMTDAELDREWKPSGRRPQSTIARSFSAELMDIFKIENSVADLDSEVDKRKHTVSLHNNELQALEAQLREMEDRLKRSQHRPGIPNYNPDSASSADNDASSAQKDEPADKAKSRPGSSMTARPAPSSGDMPPTPVASEGEYEVVNRADLEDEETARPRA